MVILPLFLFFTTALAQQTPLEQLIREVIYQTNKDNVKNHRDVLEVPGFTYNDYVYLEVGKISASNFSTVTLVGTPVVEQVKKDKDTSYVFDLSIGLEVLKLQFEYDFKSFLISSSGRLDVKNAGNALRAKGVVNTFSGKTPCNAVLETIEVHSLGSLELEFSKSSIINWILKHVAKLGFKFGGDMVRPYINGMISDQVKSSNFQSVFSKLACTPFDF